MLHLRTARSSRCKFPSARNDRQLLILLSATALAQLVQVSAPFQAVSVAALVDLAADMVVVDPDSAVVAASVVFLALQLATSVVDQTTTPAIARPKQ